MDTPSAATKVPHWEHSRPSDTEKENPLNKPHRTTCRYQSSPHSCDPCRPEDSRCARTMCRTVARALSRPAPTHTHPRCLGRSDRSRDRLTRRQATHSPSSSSHSCTAPPCHTGKDTSPASRPDSRSCSARRSKTPESPPAGHSPLDSQSRNQKDSASSEISKALH